MSSQTIEMPTPPHRSCAQLMVPGLADDTIHRLVLGEDDRPVRLSSDDVIQTLKDPLATLALAQPPFPATAGDVLDALTRRAPAGSPLARQQFFLVGEGSQIARAPAARVERNLRFLVTTGSGPEGPDVMVSAFHPDQGVVEVMAWDEVAGGFNFYRTMPNSRAWVFAGNSRHALSGPSRGHGPFESHVNGHFLMKELRFPWVHWHSPAATVSPSVLADQGLATHPWVQRLEPGGAYTLEDAVAKPAVERWTRARMSALTSGTSAEGPRRLLEQLLGTLTVNLMSSRVSSAAAVSGAASSVDIPDSFFVDSATLSVLGLSLPAPFSVPADVYATALGRFGFRLEDGAGFSRPGDTHFAFVVPERAHEDVVTIRQAIENGVLSRRLVACLLMVDFPNPVFSEHRASLLNHVPGDEVSQGADAFAQAMADAIMQSDAATTAGSPEHEFTGNWNVGEAFDDIFNNRLTAYYQAAAERLLTQDGFDEYTQLAETRRDGVRAMPIAESSLLFATTNIPSATRRMTTAATVQEAP